ncbi:MAG: hypothetical protein OXU64_13285 [Gemmatimonadota bacterium]|nr:hypothetical protein [Gemmatimonadota bacterium]
MRTIVRRDDGTEYEEWLEQLAAASGIETPTRRRCGFGTPRALRGLAWAQAELAARAADAASAFIRRSKTLFRLLSAVSAAAAANPGRRRPNPPFLHNPGRLCPASTTHKRISLRTRLSTAC